MGLRYRKRIGPKGFKLNVGKKGINSTSIRIAKGITYNSKRGLTIGIPGTGLSYNFGKQKQSKKAQKPVKPLLSPEEQQAIIDQRNAKHELSLARMNARIEYNKGWKEYTGGYSKKAGIAVAISLILCITPWWPFGLLLSIPSLLWFIIDTSVKIFKYKKHLKNS